MKEYGRVQYVEPNDINNENKSSGILSNSIPEDLTFYVDFEVKVINRLEINEKGKTYVYSFQGGKQNIHKGENGFLTINYTSEDGVSSEGLGLTSLNVSFTTVQGGVGLTPLVEARFVDVRGVNVLEKKAMAENSLSIDEYLRSNTLYNSFFVFPYPEFKMTLKGFYGKSVTYSLVPNQTINVEFDSTTGNFFINVKFSGYMFGIYNDIPFLYVCLAPYMDYVGKSYWEMNREKGRFAIGSTKMPTFAQLKKSITEAASSEPVKDVLDNIDEYRRNFESEMNSFFDFVNKKHPLKDNKAIEWVEDKTCKVVYGVKEKRFSGYVIDRFGSMGKSFDEELSKYSSNNIIPFDLSCLRCSDYKIIEIPFNIEKGKLVLEHIERTDIKQLIQYESNTLKNNEYSFLYIDFKESTFLSECLGNLENEFENYKLNLTEEFKRKQNQLIEKSLGFSPTVRNIYKILYAHIETFMYTLKSLVSNIMANNGRKSEDIGISIEMTDVCGAKNSIPPFPYVYSENKIMWIGNMNENIEEVKFVESMFYAMLSYLHEDKQSDAITLTDDSKLSVYMTLKTIYDRWYVNDFDRWLIDYKESDFNQLIYVDSFFKDIGDRILIDSDFLKGFLGRVLPASQFSEGDSVKSIYGFMSAIAGSCDSILLAMPVYHNVYNRGYIENLFKPYPHITQNDNGNPYFAFVYTYRPSRYLDVNDETRNDTFYISSENSSPKDFYVDNGYVATAFGVSFGKRNQSFFKAINLTSDNPNITDIALRKTEETSVKSSVGPQESVNLGQNIYGILASYQYECKVDMMGNAQILPLMYFQLNDIPFWGGTYQITKVKHSILPGNMTTTFTGIRLNRNSLPFYNGETITLDYNGIKSYDSNEEIIGNEIYSYPFQNEIDIKNPNVLEKGLYIKKFFMERLGWSSYMASALVGCLICENGSLNPAVVNIREKNGTLLSSSASYKKTKPNSEYNYGAGLIQWSFYDRKMNLLNYMEKKTKGGIHGKWTANNFIRDCMPGTSYTPENSDYKGGVENLSFEEQIDCIGYELTTKYSNANQSIMMSKTIEEAVAVLFCDYIGGGPNDIRIPSPQTVANKVNKYMKVNNTDSDFPFYRKRLGIAKFFNKL